RRNPCQRQVHTKTRTQGLTQAAKPTQRPPPHDQPLMKGVLTLRPPFAKLSVKRFGGLDFVGFGSCAYRKIPHHVALAANRRHVRPHPIMLPPIGAPVLDQRRPSLAPL